LHNNSSITLSFPIIVTPQINISEYIQVHDLPCFEGNQSPSMPCRTWRSLCTAQVSFLDASHQAPRRGLADPPGPGTAAIRVRVLEYRRAFARDDTTTPTSSNCPVLSRKVFECSFFFWSLIYRVSGRGPKYIIGARGVYRGTSCYELASKDHAQPRSGPHPASILNAKAMAQKPHPWGSQRTPESHGQGTSSPRTLNKMISSDDDVTQIAVSLFTGVIRTDDQAAGKYGAGGVTVG
jgi:hypothetical protein